jgi:Na+/glutamate symporter
VTVAVAVAVAVAVTVAVAVAVRAGRAEYAVQVECAGRAGHADDAPHAR